MYRIVAHSGCSHVHTWIGQVHTWISANRPDLENKVVIITGDYANEETVTTLRKIGALYLEKPFRVQDLISAVEKTMGKAR